MWQYRLQVLVNKFDNLIPRFVKRGLKSVAPGVVDGFYHTLTRITPEELAEVTIQGGPLAGRQFVCSLKDSRQYFLGNHEPDTVAYLQRAVSSGATVIDAGGHTGYVAMVMASLVGERGAVIVYEPSDSNLSILRRNLALNKDLEARIRLRAVAVSDQPGEVTFQAVQSWTGRIGAAGDTPGTASRVQAVTLDQEVADLAVNPALVMMDIEGGETAAFKGMRELVSRQRPQLIVELHDSDAHRAFVELLREFRYEGSLLGSGSWGPNPSWSRVAQYVARPT